LRVFDIGEVGWILKVTMPYGRVDLNRVAYQGINDFGNGEVGKIGRVFRE
jgi:hypothetical protein